jgi:hypothetical protein
MSVNDLKAEQMYAEAAEALRLNHTHFTPIFNMPAFRVGFSGNVWAWAVMTNAVVRAGWRLEHWAVGVDRQGRPQAMPVFVPA